MNTRLNTLAALIAVAAAGFAAPVFAQEATPDGFDRVVSVASRDAVQAQAVAAVKAGTIEYGEASIDRTALVSAKSRVQVAAEAAEALRLGAIGFGEGPSPVLTPAQNAAIQMAGLQAAGSQVAAR